MKMPFEWVVGDSSKDHTVTAPVPSNDTLLVTDPGHRATPLYGALLFELHHPRSYAISHRGKAVEALLKACFT